MDETIIVTGSSGQLGREIIKQLLEKNYHVVGMDINKDNNLPDSNNFKFIKVDLTKKTEIVNAFKKIKNHKLVGLVNNAGTAVFTKFEDRTEEEIDFVFNINIKAPILCVQCFIKYAENNWVSSIVNLGSIYGLTAPDQSIYLDTPRNSSEIYGMTKAANINLTKYLATYLKKYQIRSNCVSPGGIYFNQGNNFVNEYSKKVPMSRMADVNEIAEGILFLLDNKKSQYINGHNLVIDGGLLSGC